MPDFPLHPTLFFSLSCFIGLLLGWLFYLSDSITENNNLKYATLFLQSTWAIAAFFTIYLFILLSQDHSKAIEGINSVFGYIKYLEIQKNSINAQSLAPLGMMIAALIASASVMKNIAETKANEAEKHAKEASKFHLEKCTEGLEHVYDLLKDKNNQHDKWEAAANSLITILELSKNITEPHHKHFFALEKSKYCLKLNKLYTDINEFFFSGSTEWSSITNNIGTAEYLKKRVEKAGSPGYAKNIDPSSIRVIFSVCIDSLHQKISDVPLHKWKTNNPEITENELSWWKAHNVLQHAVPLIEYFQKNPD